jgi:prolyl oligopeptidase
VQTICYLMFDNTKHALAAQVDLTGDYLKKSTDRAKLKELMMENVDFPKVRLS